MQPSRFAFILVGHDARAVVSRSGHCKLLRDHGYSRGECYGGWVDSTGKATRHSGTCEDVPGHLLDHASAELSKRIGVPVRFI